MRLNAISGFQSCFHVWVCWIFAAIRTKWQAPTWALFIKPRVTFMGWLIRLQRITRRITKELHMRVQNIETSYRKSPCISRFFSSKFCPKLRLRLIHGYRKSIFFLNTLWGSSRGLMTFPNINCFKWNFSQLSFVFLGEKPTKEF